jgi:hypothetical protein
MTALMCGMLANLAEPQAAADRDILQELRRRAHGEGVHTAEALPLVIAGGSADGR